MPNVGDELHHFGWNACTSALCPWAPHPHVERRYLLVPGLRSSRIHVVDIKDDPRAAQARQGDRARGARAAHRLQPPAHDPLRPRRHLRERARRARRQRPGRRAAARPRRLRSAGPLGGRPRPAGAGLRLLVEHRLRHAADQRVGHAEDGRGRRSCPSCCSAASTATSCTSGICAAPPHAGDRSRRRAADGARAAPRARPDQAYGFVGVVVSTADLSASVWLWNRENGSVAVRKVIEIPAEPADADQLPGRAQAVRGGAAADHRHQPVARRPLPLRVVLGHRRAQALRRLRSVQSARGRLGAASAGSSRRAAHPGGGRVNGGPQMVEVSRDGRRVYLTNSLYADLGRAVLSRGHRRLAGEARLRAGRRVRRSIRTSSSSSTASARTRCSLQGGDASSDSYCFP